MAEQAEKGLETEELCARIEELERRVAALEKCAGTPSRPRLTAGESVPAPGQLETEEDLRGVNRKEEREAKTGGAGVVPVFGKAVLAIAGAYLLRAVAESGAAPRWIMLMVGIGYAGVWLVWAARTEKRSHFASVMYALTVAAILVPLLWEGTVRFGDLSAGVAATVLAGYLVLSLSLEWKNQAGAIGWIAVVAAVATMAALIVATHELAALTLGMLGLAFVGEVVSWSGRRPAARVVTGLGAIFALAVVGIVVTSGVPASYPAISAGEIAVLCVGMSVVFGGSFVVRGFGLKMPWTVAEVSVLVVVVVLGTWASLRATQGGAAGFWGILFLGMAGVCYRGALQRFATVPESHSSTARNDCARWNRRVSANFAAALVLAGSWLLLGGNLQVLLLSTAAMVAVIVFTRTGYLSLGIHGTFYLLAAGAVCGLFGYAGQALAGTVPAWPGWSFWLVAGTSLATYLVGARAAGNAWNARVLWVVPAAVVGFAGAAVIVAGIVSAGGPQLSASRLSMVRTVVTCLMALGMAYAGSHWKRTELGWVAYGAIGLGALKLVLEDLRFGNAGTLMVSLLFYGAMLILLPKVMREKAAESEATGQ